jgi:hypothetical protein
MEQAVCDRVVEVVDEIVKVGSNGKLYSKCKKRVGKILRMVLNSERFSLLARVISRVEHSNFDKLNSMSDQYEVDWSLKLVDT